jgi:hypothetical protein
MAGVLEVIKAKDAGLLKATFRHAGGLQPLLIKLKPSVGVSWEQILIRRSYLIWYAAPNNSFNRSANSAAFIVNLAVSTLDARPVNSGVRRYIQSKHES